MYDTVDQAHGPVPRALAGIIQDARRPDDSARKGHLTAARGP
jgi:hypothetical protein